MIACKHDYNIQDENAFHQHEDVVYYCECLKCHLADKFITMDFGKAVERLEKLKKT